MTPQQKALDLVKSHFNFVSGWTEINRPDQSAAAQYEGAGMKVGRAIQCAIVTARECRDVANPLNDELQKQFWNGVINHLKEMIA